MLRPLINAMLLIIAVVSLLGCNNSADKYAVSDLQKKSAGVFALRGIMKEEEYLKIADMANHRSSLSEDEISFLLNFIENDTLTTEKGNLRAVMAVPVLSDIPTIPSKERSKYRNEAMKLIKFQGQPSSLRMHGIKMIAKLKDGDSAELIRPFLNDTDAIVREHAQKALASLSSKG